MSISQRITWTLLPNGTTGDGRRLRASVLVSPRLTLTAPPSKPPFELRQFEQWSDWPEVIRKTQFKVRILGGATLPAQPDLSKLDSAVWKGLFPLETRVRPNAAEDWRDRIGRLPNMLILSYPVAELAEAIEGLYGQLARRAGDDLPTTQFLLNEPSSNLAMLRERVNTRTWPQFLKDLRDESSRSRLSPIELLTTYHRPLEAEAEQEYPKRHLRDSQTARWRMIKPAPLPSRDQLKDAIDFHQTVSALCQYPELLRRTGFVIDLELVGVPAGEHALQLDVDWPVIGAVKREPDILPPIAVQVGDKVFHARSKASSGPRLFVGRYLDLSTERHFQLVQMDVDGGGLKIKNFALSLPNIQQTAHDDDDFVAREPTAGVPSLRSAGLMLVHKGRDLPLKDQFKASKDLLDKVAMNDETLKASENLSQDQRRELNLRLNANLTLYLEDIVRGYRADIHDSLTGKWQSLCRRDSTYVLRHETAPAIPKTNDEEGMIRLAAAGPADANPETKDVLKVHEGLFSWKGWSLCAPEPGRVLQPEMETTEDPADPANSADGSESAVPDGLPLDARFTVRDGSLPSLRFGRAYTARVRLVDLAGNSVSYSDPHPPQAVSKTPVVFRR